MIPPLDPAGILVAIVSAALFTVAIVYVVRSRATNIETPLTVALSGDSPLVERELFSIVMVTDRIPGRGLMLSVALHLFVLTTTPLLPYLFPERINLDRRKFNVKIMEFRIPAPLLYTAPARPAPERPVARVRIQEAGRPATHSARKATPPPVQAATPKRPRLELPHLARARSKDVVIQPDQPPDVPMVIPQPLPTTFLWAQGPAPPEISKVVGAPPKLTLPVFALPRSTPRVQKPNREIAISDLQVGAAPALTFRPPRLPVPAANSSPVRIPSPPIEAPGELPASALPGGTPMNLIALMGTPAPPAAGYLLEAGNRLAESQPAAGGPSGTKAESASSSETSTTTGNTAASASNAAPGAGNAASPGVGPVKGTQADLLAGAGGATGGKAAGTGATTGTSVLPSNAMSPAKPSTQPFPTGNLGIIIVQQSAQEAVLEGGEVLSGQPVYTVYFDVPGAPRRWILQYCVPGSVFQPSAVSSDGVVRIVPRRSVQPPFPLERTPVDLKGFSGEARRLVLYAMVNERGETENVRLIRGTGHEIDNMAVAILRKWMFRPATRGDTPVAVEALFGIPLQ